MQTSALLQGAMQLLSRFSAGAEPCVPLTAPHPVNGPYNLDYLH